MESLIKIQPDKERARSLLKLAMLRHEKIKTYSLEKESTLIAEGYYEVAKELATAIMFIDGYKTLSHKDLIGYLSKTYKEDFKYTEINLLNQLRKLRNSIVYYGVFIESSYIKRNNIPINDIINKLKLMVEKKID